MNMEVLESSLVRILLDPIFLTLIPIQPASQIRSYALQQVKDWKDYKSGLLYCCFCQKFFFSFFWVSYLNPGR